MTVWAVIGVNERGQRTVAVICTSADVAARKVGELAIAQLYSGAPIGEMAYHIDAGPAGNGFEVVE